MKKVYALLALVVAAGSVAILAGFFTQPIRTSVPGASGDNRVAAEAGRLSDPITSAQLPGEKPNEASGTGVAQAKTSPSVASPEKVVSVREAYRQALKDEQKTSPSADVNPPASELCDTSAAVPKQTADEPAIIDQPRLWLPAAMLEPDESIPITSELQVAEWQQLQEEFVQAVGGRAPSNATEKEAWIRAQQDNDDLFRAKFGWDAFRLQQLKAYKEGLAPALPQ